VITQVDPVAVPQGFSAQEIPSAFQNIKDVCPGELTAPLPAEVSTTAITSANSVQWFDYAAAPGMTPEAVRAHVASWKGLSTDGIVFTEVPVDSNKTYTASPEGFVDLIRDVHPHLGRVLWHSIVSDGQRCERATVGGEMSQGSQYGELSRLTGGAIENICAPSFGPFLEKVAVSVKHGPVLRYALDPAVASHVRKIENKTRNLTLVLEKDYRITATSIEFTPSAPIGPTDSVAVSYSN